MGADYSNNYHYYLSNLFHLVRVGFLWATVSQNVLIDDLYRELPSVHYGHSEKRKTAANQIDMLMSRRRPRFISSIALGSVNMFNFWPLHRLIRRKEYKHSHWVCINTDYLRCLVCVSSNLSPFIQTTFLIIYNGGFG